jgi:hypothetical protein
MRSMRTAVAGAFVLLLSVAVVWSATQNYVPKYDSGGALIDSAIYESGGKVGIGTSTPSAALDVRQSIAYTGAIIDGELLTLKNLSDQATSASMLSFHTVRNSAAGGATYWAAGIKAVGIHGGAGTYPTASLHFAVNDGGGSVHTMLKIDPTSGVMISPPPSPPATLLRVQGNVIVDGNIAAKYQDVAEWVEARDPVSPGTVVVIDSGDTNVVESSQKSYDTAVAGVVSAQPGIVLGEKGPGKVLIAQSGRVRVRVDASYGAVSAGDLLVTSPSAGYAMRSEPIEMGGIEIHRPGTVVGKAIEALPKGRGEILVLLTLQ